MAPRRAGRGGRPRLPGLLFYDDGLLTDRIYAHAETNRQTGTGIAPVALSREAARFLRENRVEGPLFTTFSAGSYFAWAYPEQKEFIDGRLEVHTAEHYQRYLRMLSGGEAWAAAEKQYGFNAAVIQYMDAPTLTLERLRDPTWAAVHLDDTALVLVKRDGRNDALIQKESLSAARLSAAFPSLSTEQLNAGGGLASVALPPIPSALSPVRLFTAERFPWSAIHLGQFFTMVNRWEYALPQFVAAARSAPRVAAPRLMAAVCLTQLKMPREALAILDGAARIGGSKDVRARLYSARGDVLLALNRTGEAVDSYGRSLENTPESSAQFANVLASRAYARLKAGDSQHGLADIRESLRRQPGSAGSYWILGLIQEALGQPEAALQSYERFKAMGGKSPEVDAALQRLQRL